MVFLSRSNNDSSSSPSTRTSASPSSSRLRRKRPKFEKCTNPISGHGLVDGEDGDGNSSGGGSGGLSTPFEYTGDSVDEYSNKASLSPWTPVPDSVARRIFDNADIQPDDVSLF